MDIRTELLKYNGVLIPDRYNMFFNPNLCHICKSANNGRLLLCDKCYMISYCGVQHKIMHQEEHSVICGVITQLSQRDLLGMNRLTSTECLHLKQKIYHLVEKNMCRPIHMYEIGLIFFARTCYICHRWFDVYTCGSCYSANFCHEHAQDFLKYHHTSKCKKLLIYLNCKINYANTRGRNLETLKFYEFPEDIKCSSNVLDFIGLNVHFENENWSAKPWTTDLLSLRDYNYSEHISYPLALFYGLQDANLVHILSTPVCVIHVILEYTYVAWLLLYDVLFHLLGHEVRKIVIIFISQFILEWPSPSVLLDTCSTCKLNKKILILHTFPFCYENYVCSTDYRRPNIVVSFNKGAKRWTRACLTALQDQNCPLLSTFATLYQAKTLTNYIKNILGVEQPCIRKNRFGSLFPIKSISCPDDVCYRNQYYVIYERLKVINEPSTSRTHT